ncbi:MAG: alanine racemase [Crocinitomicaceae bacterium]|nr:alanine racemase [Crocinitomicaceae bacterium]
MKLEYVYKDISLLISKESSDDQSIISSVVFDTRRIANPKGVLFFALEGVFRDGHDFIEDAYAKGVRHFVVSKRNYTKHLEGAHEIVVNNVLWSLQNLAANHRKQFDCKVVAITGSNGKTTVKEWLAQLLSKDFHVTRSPKSYNSKLGVAISLLEITAATEIALIEVGVPEPGEMHRIEKLIVPTHGILTSFGTAHSMLFDSEEAHLSEKLTLLRHVNDPLYASGISLPDSKRWHAVSADDYTELIEQFPFKDNINKQNVSLAIAMAMELGVTEEAIKDRIPELSSLALRLETYDGINNNSIINDTYTLDKDSLRLSLEYQLANAIGKKRIVIVGHTESDEIDQAEIEAIIQEFAPDEYYFYTNGEEVNQEFNNASILIKGSRKARMELLANQFKQQHHQTYLEIDLTAVRHNINFHKSLLKPETKIMCMVKASSYGSDAKTMSKFISNMGVNYLGVAYTDEGIQLRESGVKLPILVMNCEERSFAQCIDNNLEPAIFSLNQLTSFIKELINRSMVNYPIHIKLESGMNRLGFNQKDLSSLIATIKSQPEVIIKSIYSHLAESDKVNSPFTERQIEVFGLFCDQIENEFPHPILRHILNSAGIQNYPHAQFDMARLGIGMYGVTNDPNLRPAISWYSTVSQVKELEVNDTVGYGRSFKADKAMKIAIIPVGYADGYRRSLSQGKGGVVINEKFCPTIGNVCMDMIMVDVSGQSVQEGDRVEIIGNHMSMEKIAMQLDTISYEVMTSLSMRLQRLFVDQ